MSGKQQDAKLDMPLSEVIKKVPKGDKKSKKRKSVDGVAAPDQAGKSPSKPKNKNKAKKTAAPNGTKKAKKGSGGAQPSTSPAKPRRNRTGSATKKPARGFQITVLQEGAPTAAGRVRAARTAQQDQSPQKQAKKNKRANAGLQVSPAIKKKSGQSPARKVKNNNNNNNNQGQGKKKKRTSGSGAAAGGAVTLNQRFSALKSGRN